MTPRPFGGKGDDWHDDELRRRQEAHDREVANHMRAIAQLDEEKRENERLLEDSVILLLYTKSSCFQCSISFQKRKTNDKRRELIDVLVSLSYLLLFSHNTHMVLF